MKKAKAKRVVKKTRAKKAIRKVCMWCGRSHKKAPKKCKHNSTLMSYWAKQGTPVWVLFAMLDRYGVECLEKDRFVEYGELFLNTKPGTKRKR